LVWLVNEVKMGRRKTQSKEETLAKAVAVFREMGFSQASADVLVERTGATRYSLYTDFGSLSGLFEAALDRYNRETIEQRFGPLETDHSGFAEIHDLLSFYGKAGDGAAVGLGCLLCNTAVEFGKQEPVRSNVIEPYIERLSGAFHRALRNEDRRRNFVSETSPNAEAAHLAAIVLGLFVLIRAAAPAAMIENAASTARSHLHMLEKRQS
jgi:TetR/AcrR family transcriptional repressor of nem operon